MIRTQPCIVLSDIIELDVDVAGKVDARIADHRGEAAKLQFWIRLCIARDYELAASS